jgi:hypothetical protein
VVNATAAYKSDAYSSVLGNPPNHGAIRRGTSAQPFKTEKDYTNFLKEWIGTASGLIRQMVYMKKESKKLVLPRKTDCEDDSAICRYAQTTEDNLYSSIN